MDQAAGFRRYPLLVQWMAEGRHPWNVSGITERHVEQVGQATAPLAIQLPSAPQRRDATREDLNPLGVRLRSLCEDGHSWQKRTSRITMNAERGSAITSRGKTQEGNGSQTTLAAEMNSRHHLWRSDTAAGAVSGGEIAVAKAKFKTTPMRGVKRVAEPVTNRFEVQRTSDNIDSQPGVATSLMMLSMTFWTMRERSTFVVRRSS